MVRNIDVFGCSQGEYVSWMNEYYTKVRYLAIQEKISEINELYTEMVSIIVSRKKQVMLINSINNYGFDMELRYSNSIRLSDFLSKLIANGKGLIEEKNFLELLNHIDSYPFVNLFKDPHENFTCKLSWSGDTVQVTSPAFFISMFYNCDKENEARYR